MAQRLGNVVPAGQAQASDAEVAQAGQCLRPVAGAHLGAVFIKGDVPHPVKFVLNPYVLTSGWLTVGVKPLRLVEIREREWRQFIRQPAQRLEGW